MNKDQIQKQINELTPFYQSNYVLNADWLRQSVSKPLVEPINVKLTKAMYTYSPLRYADTIYRYNKAREEQELDAKVAAENNSLADAFWSFNSILPSLLQGRPEDAQAYLNNIMHYGKNFVKPLLNVDENGNWNPYFGAWALQRFQALLEDLDVIANPVKGLFLEGFDGLAKQGAERIVGSDGKAIMARKNYTYNTGNGWLDFALEVVSDPANWVTLGTKAAASSIAKGSAKAFMSEAGGAALKTALRKSLGKEVAEETVEKMAYRTTKKVIKELSQHGITKEKSILKTIEGVKGLGKLDDVSEETVIRAFKKVLSNTEGLKPREVEVIAQRLSQPFTKVINAAENITDTQTVSNAILKKASATILRSLNKAYVVGDAVDSGILKFAFAETGIYPAYKLLKNMPHNMAKFTSKILGDSIEVVLKSPISSGKNAAETIQHIVTTLNADSELQTILETVGKGAVSEKELSGIILAKVHQTIDSLQETLRKAKKAKSPIGATAAIDAVVKKEYGYETFEAFVKDMQTLKGNTTAIGQRAIYRLEKFQQSIIKADIQKVQKLGQKAYKARKEMLEALSLEAAGKAVVGDAWGETIGRAADETTRTIFEETNQTAAMAGVKNTVSEKEFANVLAKVDAAQKANSLVDVVPEFTPETDHIVAQLLDEIKVLDTVDASTVVKLNEALDYGAVGYKKVLDAVLSQASTFNAFSNPDFIIPLQVHLADAIQLFHPIQQFKRLALNQSFATLSETITILKHIKAYTEILALSKTYLNPDKCSAALGALLRAMATKPISEAEKYKTQLKKFTIMLLQLEQTAPTAALRHRYAQAVQNMLEVSYRYTPVPVYEQVLKMYDTVVNLRKTGFADVHKDTIKFLKVSPDVLIKLVRPSALINLDVSEEILQQNIIHRCMKRFDALLTGVTDYDADVTKLLDKITNTLSGVKELTEKSTKEILSELNIGDDIAKLISDTDNIIKSFKTKAGFNSDAVAKEMTDAKEVAKIMKDVFYKMDNGINVVNGDNLLDIANSKKSRKAILTIVDFLKQELETLPAVEAGSSADTFMARPLADAVHTLNKFISAPEKVTYDAFKTAYDTCSKYIHNLDTTTKEFIDKTISKIDAEDLLRYQDIVVTEFATFSSVKIDPNFVGISIQDADKLKRLTKFIKRIENLSDSDVLKRFMKGETVSKEDLLEGIQQAVKAYNNQGTKGLGADTTTLCNALSMFEPTKVVSEKIKLAAHAVWYMLKGEQMWNTANFLSNKQLVEQIADLSNQGSSVYRSLRVLADTGEPDVAEIAETIISLSENFKVYLNTYTSINNLAANGLIDEQELTAIQSTLQKYALHSVSNVGVDPEVWFKKFLKECRDYYNNTYVYREAYAQEAILERGDYAKMFGTEKVEYYHLPNADAYCTLAIAHKEKAMQEFLNNPENGCVGKRLKAFDIETTDDGRILSLGIADDIKEKYSENVGHRFTIQFATKKEVMDHIYQDDLLHEMIPHKPDPVKEFVTRHHNVNPKPQKQVYEEFLTELFKDGDDVVLCGHNCNEFDMPRMTKAFEEAGVSEELLTKFKNAQVIDNLEVIRKANGYVTLATDSTKLQCRDELLEIFTNHLEELQLASGYFKFFDMGIKPIKQQVSELMKMIKDSNTPSSKTIYTSLKGMSETNDLLTALEQLRNNIIETSVRVSDFTSDLPLISKQAVKTQLPELMANIFDVGTDTHFSRALYGWTTGINPFGYKVAIDADVVMNWFKFSEGDELETTTLMHYTNKGRGLNKYREKIKDYVATLDEETINQYRQFIREAQEQNTDPLSQAWLQELRTDYLDNASVVAAASVLYLNNKKKLPGQLLKKYEDVLQGIKRDYIINYTKLKDAAIYDEITQRLFKQTNLYDAIDETEYWFGLNRMLSTTQHMQNSALRRVLHYAQSFTQTLLESAEVSRPHLIRAQRNAFNNLCVTQTLDIISLNPIDMRTYMLSNRAPIMFFDTDVEQLSVAAKQLLAKEKELAEVGISIKQVDNEIFIYFNKQQQFEHFFDEEGFHAVFNGEQYDIDLSLQHKLTLNDGLHDVESLKAIHDEFATITNGQSIGQLGTTLTKEQLEGYISVFPKVILDDINPAALTKSTMFNGYLFDSMNLGTVVSRRKYNQYLPTDYIKLLANNASDIIHHAKEKNLTLNYLLNADMSVRAMINQYGEESVKKLLLQDDSYVVIQLAQSAKLTEKKVGFRGLGLKIKELNPKYADDWTKIISEESGCVIVPRYMYSEIYEALNSSVLYTNPFYKTLHSISYLTKLGQIGTVGKVFRDAVEGTLKTMVETGNVLGTLKNTGLAMKNLNEYKKAVQNILKLSEIDYQKLVDIGMDAEDIADFATKYINNQCEAFSLIQNYYSSLKDIMKMDANKIFLDANKELYFSQICKTMDIDTFNTMHTLITESGTLGKLPAWSRYTADLHKEKQKQFIKDFNEGLIGDMMIEGNKNIGEQVYDTFVNFGNLLLTPAQYLDQVNRVAQYLTFMDAGFVNPTAAIGKVSRTFFDATVKTESEMIAELFIPFYAFFKHNTIYWAKAVDEHPYIARMFGDLLSELQDEDSIPHVTDYEEMHNQSLQNTMLAGNWVLNAIDTRRKELEGGAIDQDAVTLKLNFPFMEAYQMATRPISYMLNATNPAIQLALQSWLGNNPSVPTAVTSALDIYRPYNFDEGARGNLDYYSLIPFVGPTIQRWGPDGYAYKQYEKTGFLGNLVLPSVFGVLNRFPEYPELSAATKTITSSVRPKGLSSKQYQYLSRNGFNTQQKTTGTRRKIKGYSTGRTKQPYVKKHRYYTKKAFRTMYYPPRRKPDNTVYRRLFNSYGKTRIQQIGIPKMVKRSQYTLRNYFNYLR